MSVTIIESVLTG